VPNRRQCRQAIKSFNSLPDAPTSTGRVRVSTPGIRAAAERRREFLFRRLRAGENRSVRSLIIVVIDIDAGGQDRDPFRMVNRRPLRSRRTRRSRIHPPGLDRRDAVLFQMRCTPRWCSLRIEQAADAPQQIDIVRALVRGRRSAHRLDLSEPRLPELRNVRGMSRSAATSLMVGKHRGFLKMPAPLGSRRMND